MPGYLAMNGFPSMPQFKQDAMMEKAKSESLD
jgi:hypothetical protein